MFYLSAKVIHPCVEQVSGQGFELTIAVNLLAHQALLQRLLTLAKGKDLPASG